jgi:hypothetical protein
MNSYGSLLIEKFRIGDVSRLVSKEVILTVVCRFLTVLIDGSLASGKFIDSAECQKAILNEIDA